MSSKRTENKRKPTPSMYDDEEAMRELDKQLTKSKMNNRIQNIENHEPDKTEVPQQASTSTTNNQIEKPKTRSSSRIKAASNQVNAETTKSKTAIIKPDNNEKQEKVYQFKISLECTKPLVWRRILVPESFTFAELHNAIQNSMGWYNIHLHRFICTDPNVKSAKKVEITSLKSLFDSNSTKATDETKATISSFFKLDTCKLPGISKKAYSIAEYEYDSEDKWVHNIELENILYAESGRIYPICIDGKNNCPPEDCGSWEKFAELKKIIKNPKHPDHQDMMSWLKFRRTGAGDYDPESFDHEKVQF